MNEPRACIDRILFSHEEAATLRAVRPPSLAALNEKVWPNGATLRCTFQGGDPAVRAKVEQYAHAWEAHANIRFSFGAFTDAAIRIAFQPGGSWSYLGTDALAIPRGEATMNFGWLDASTNDTEYSRVVIHEFGHALGCVHEHQSPAGGVPWDVPAVLAYYSRPPNNWSREEIEANLFQKYAADITRFSAYDPTSVMHYPVPEEFTVGTFSVGWNVVLSETDKQYAAILYPKPAPPPPPPPPTDPWNEQFNAEWTQARADFQADPHTPKIGYVRGWQSLGLT